MFCLNVFTVNFFFIAKFASAWILSNRSGSVQQSNPVTPMLASPSNSAAVISAGSSPSPWGKDFDIIVCSARRDIIIEETVL